MVNTFRDIFGIIQLGDVCISPEFHVEDIVVLVHSKARAKKDGSGAAWNSPQWEQAQMLAVSKRIDIP